MSIEVDDLVIRVRGDSSSLEKGMKKSEQKVKKSVSVIKKSLNTLTAAFGTMALALGPAILAYKAFATISDDFARLDSLGKVSDRLGVTVKGLNGLRLAATQTGIEISTLESGLLLMNRNLTEANTGIGPAADAFRKLGLSAQTLISLDPAEAFGKIAEGIKALGTQSDKTATAFDIFGRQGALLLNTFELGADGLAKMTREADELSGGLTRMDISKVEAANDAFDKMGRSVEGLTQQFSIMLAGPLQDIADYWTDVIKSMNKAGDAAERATGKMVDDSFLSQLVAAEKELKAFNAELQKRNDLPVFSPRRNIGLKRLIEDIDFAKAKIEGLKNVIRDGEESNIFPKEFLDFLDNKPSEEQLAASDTGEVQGPVPPPEVMTDLLATNFELFAEHNLRLEDEKARFLDAMLGQEDRLAQETEWLWESGFKGRLIIAKNFLEKISAVMETGSRKQFEVGKAAAIAEAGINTFKAAQGAYAAMSGIPIIGPALGIAAAGAAVAAGVANVQKIKSTTMGGGAPSGGGGGLTPSVPSGGEVPGGGASTPEAAPNVTNANISLFGDNFSGDSVRNLISAINEQTDDNVVLKVNQ